MGKHALRMILLFAALACTVPAEPLEGPPGKDSLVLAWEQLQREDPLTLSFEKIGEGRYAFHTERFPFDGELLLLNASVDGQAGGFPGLTVGVVEVELAGVDESFYRKHGMVYGRWTARNQLFWDEASHRWMSADECEFDFARPGHGGILGSILPLFSNFFWLFFLLLTAVFFWWISRHAKRQMNKAMEAQDKALSEQERAFLLTERALALHEETNSLLKEIRDRLQKGRSAP